MTWDTWLQARGIDPEKLEPGAEIDLTSIPREQPDSTEDQPTAPVTPNAKPPTMSEWKFEQAWKLHGDGTAFEREYRFHEHRKWRADFAFVEARVLVEIEGMQSASREHEGRHRSFTGFMNDASKYNAAVVAGWAVYRVPSVWLYSDLKAKQICDDIRQLIKERTVKVTINPEAKETTFKLIEEEATSEELGKVLGEKVVEELAQLIDRYFAAVPNRLTFVDYQKRTAETAVYPEVGKNPYYVTLGLCGEAGEVAEKVKKVMRDKGGVFDDEARAAIGKELGDQLWYIARLADELGLDLGALAADNLAKLADRKARGVIKGEGDER